SRIQSRRARATSARCCSAALRLFFKRDLMALKEAPHSGATTRKLALAHRTDDLVQRQIRLHLNQRQQKVRVLLQWRGAAAPRLGCADSCRPVSCYPFDRGTCTDIKLLRCLAPRGPALHTRDHST